MAEVEKRTTKSWHRSVEIALRGILKSNKRRSADGYYLKPDEIRDTIEKSFPGAISGAAYEAFEGICTTGQLVGTIDADKIKQEELDKILTHKL